MQPAVSQHNIRMFMRVALHITWNIRSFDPFFHCNRQYHQRGSKVRNATTKWINGKLERETLIWMLEWTKQSMCQIASNVMSKPEKCSSTQRLSIQGNIPFRFSVGIDSLKLFVVYPNFVHPPLKCRWTQYARMHTIQAHMRIVDSSKMQNWIHLYTILLN